MNLLRMLLICLCLTVHLVFVAMYWKDILTTLYGLHYLMNNQGIQFRWIIVIEHGVVLFSYIFVFFLYPYLSIKYAPFADISRAEKWIFLGLYFVFLVRDCSCASYV